MKLKPNDFRKLVVASFLAVPALSSLISTIHIITFFGLGNMTWMAIILALAFEIGSIASLMTLAVLDKINRFAVWFIFVVLVAMQMLGNVYYTYDYISQAMATNPQWIDSFIDLVEMMTMQKLEQRTTKFILSILIGLPIPIISLAFLKSVSDYLKPEQKEEKVKEIEKEQKETTEKTSEILKDSKSNEEKPTEDIVVSEVVSEIISDSTEKVNAEEVVEIEEKDEEITDVKGDVVITEEVKDEIQLETKEEPITISEKEEIIEEEIAENELVEKSEQIIEEETFQDEIVEDIYEEEPHGSFFDDTTIEEEHDNFESEQDEDEKKSQ